MTGRYAHELSFYLNTRCHKYIVKLVLFYKYLTNLFKIAKFLPKIMGFFEPSVELQSYGLI